MYTQLSIHYTIARKLTSHLAQFISVLSFISHFSFRTAYAHKRFNALKNI